MVPNWATGGGRGAAAAPIPPYGMQMGSAFPPPPPPNYYAAAAAALGAPNYGMPNPAAMAAAAAAAAAAANGAAYPIAGMAMPNQWNGAAGVPPSGIPGSSAMRGPTLQPVYSLPMRYC